MRGFRNTLGIFLFVALLPVSIWAGTVSGQVLDNQSGLPISNALVKITGGPFSDSARTDAAGNYTLPNIPVGIYTMIVTAPLFNSDILAGVTVTAAPLTQDFDLQLTATVRGTVTNSTNGNTVLGARVILTLPSNPNFAETTFTNAQGGYLFDSVSNGNNYRITVTASGFQTAVNNTVTITDARRSGIADFSLIPVSAGGNNGSISGTVASANSGIPIARAKVVLSLAGQTVDSTLTDTQGLYQFSTVAAINGYTVTASAVTYNNAVRNNVGIVVNQTTVVDLNLNSNLGTAFGQVLQVNSTIPIANALVRILDNNGVLLGSGVSDAQGNYNIYNIPPGSNYTMIATAPLYNSIIRAGISVPNNWFNEDFNLQVTATIRGTVTNSANGLPISGARIVLTLPSNAAFVPETTTTSAQGMYLFDSVSNSGGTTYRITVTAAGFQTAVNNSVIITDALRSGIADFSLIPVSSGGTSGSISGTVASSNSGVIIVGAKVVLSLAGQAVDSTVTDALGHYQFSSVVAINGYSVTASAPTFNNSVRNNVNVVTGQTTIVDLNSSSSSSILPYSRISRAETHWVNGRLTLEIPVSNHVRTLEAYGLDGILLIRSAIPAGETHVVLPSNITREARLRVRP